jgi:imidazolonepropionase-like amidohydrolase
MKRHLTIRLAVTIAACLCLSHLSANEGPIAFVGATIIDGTEAAPLTDGVIVISNGRIRTVGPRASVRIPAGAEIIDVAGKTIMPGIVNAHAHVGDTLGLETGHYTAENLTRQLELYARYGITTVNSLGGDEAAGFALRDDQYRADLTRARVLVAGSVVTGRDAAAVRSEVNANADAGANFIKMRVDDNLGLTAKMPAELVDVLIAEAHQRRLPVAVHLFYLDDAKYILRAGADLIAHSIRDAAVDRELLDLIKARDVCYIPTLTREVSTFIYASEPEFFSDPFFLKEVDASILNQLRSPERQSRMRNSASAQAYKEGLEVAMANVDALNNAGVRIAMGTDSGPPARFQGYFSHMEMQMMVDAGMSPFEVIRSATAVAADCINANDVGTLEPGKWGDLIVLGENPLTDIANTKSIEGVWLAGNRVPD